MSNLNNLCLTFIIGLFSSMAAANNNGFFSDVGDGYNTFYHSDNLPWLGTTWLVGGILTNTDLDREIQNNYNEHIRSESTDSFSRKVKTLGDPEIAFLYAGLAAYNRLACDRDCGSIPEWGDRSLQALLVGLPAVWASQAILGGDRPYRGKSDWSVFQFDRQHAVSGHAFVGAVPFLTAAQMTDNDAAKGLFYALSTLTAWSRINDQKHYFSQALMGWLYAAKVTDVIHTNAAPGELVILPYADDKSVSLTIMTNF